MFDLKPMTLWRLLGTWHVEIPSYQRDYAQGRTDERTRYLRKDFVRHLADAVARQESNVDHSIDLGLVFGSGCDDRFVPVDGQQRLTTLYLLHWLVALRAGILNEHTDTFARFSYATRPSSADFFQMLAKGPPDVVRASSSLVAAVRDCTAYCALWEHDPTVAGALTMLEALAEALGTHDASMYREFWKHLTTEGDCRIRFTCSQAPGLADDLYIKMNARGRQLTDFENFKAWLGGVISKKVEASEWHVAPADWDRRLDTTWLDIFWTHKDTTDDQVDEEYMRFFNGVAQLSLAERWAHRPLEEPWVKTAIAALHQLEKAKEARIPLGLYEDWECFTERSIGDAFRYLYLMENGGDTEWSVDTNGIQWFDNGSESVSVFRSFIAPAATYMAKARFYALCCFLTEHSGVHFNDLVFQDWWRVIRNLLVNTPVNGQTLGGVIRAIRDLAASDKPILEYLASTIGSKPTGFSKALVDEERQKAELILDGRCQSVMDSGFSCKWDRLLSQAENLPYFQGRVGVLLEISGHDEEIFEQQLNLCQDLLKDEKEEDVRKVTFRAYTTHIGKDDLGASRIWCGVKDGDWKRLFDAKRPGIVRFLMADGRPSEFGEPEWKLNLQRYWDELKPFDGRKEIGVDPYGRWECALLYTTSSIAGVIVLDGLRVSWLPVLAEIGAIDKASRFPRSNDCGKYWTGIRSEWLQKKADWDSIRSRHIDIGFRFGGIVLRSRDGTGTVLCTSVDHGTVDVTNSQAVAEALYGALQKLCPKTADPSS